MTDTKLNTTKKENKGQFKKGDIPWNKGKPFLAGKKNPMYGKPTFGHLGKHHSQKTKKLLSKMFKGRKMSKAWIEKIGKGNLGNKHSLSARKKMSETKKGNKNPAWKGGITPKNQKIRHSIEYRLWREAVFARDNWTCEKCKQRGGRLHSHHIKNFPQYPKLRFAINNGITFCRDCHQEFHKIYGIKNNTEKQLGEFLKNKLVTKYLPNSPKEREPRPEMVKCPKCRGYYLTGENICHCKK